MSAERADISHVQNGPEPDVALNAEAEVVGGLIDFRRNNATHRSTRENHALVAQKRAQRSVILDRVVLEGRIRLKGISPGRPDVGAGDDRAIEEADPAANRGLAIAENVIREAEPRSDRGAEIVHEAFGDSRGA